MSWDTRWRALADAITDLRRSGESIPPSIIRDLRSAKTMMEIIKADRSRPEHISRLEECLGSVESYVLSTAESRLGSSYVNALIRKLHEVERIRVQAEMETQAGFHPGLPREMKWVRIQASDEIPVETIRNIAEKIGLKSMIQEDRYVLIFGEKEKIKAFIKRMAEISRAIRGSSPVV
ncbi:DUF2096 family protein [Candidatus Bathyarchaeota archaeon]|nr:DUF2096 family protein [Candidatus Bathyarchaeota archaeon]